MSEAETIPPERQLHLRLHPQGVIAPILRAIHTTSDVISVALPAIEASNFETADPPAPGTPLTISFQGGQDLAARRAAATNWLLVRGFQDLARSIRDALERAYLYAEVLTFPQGVTTWGEVEEKINEARRKANQLSFPDLITAVGDRLSANLAFADEFRSLQKARNCLEHRDGIVGATDVNDGATALRLVLPRWKIFYDKDGEEVDVQIGDYFEQDTMIKMRLDRRERIFPLGQRVTFNAGEFKEIALGCWFFADDLARKLPTAPAAPAAPVAAA